MAVGLVRNYKIGFFTCNHFKGDPWVLCIPLNHETLEILAKDFYENLNFRLPFLGKLLLITSHLMLNCLIGNMHIVFMTNVQHKIIHKRSI
jgi:hypothetical protein